MTVECKFLKDWERKEKRIQGGHLSRFLYNAMVRQLSRNQEITALLSIKVLFSNKVVEYNSEHRYIEPLDIKKRVERIYQATSFSI